MQEHASVVVETVTKTSTTTRFSGIQRFTSDATKVTASGKGLTKAFRGQTATFTVDASQAGEFLTEFQNVVLVNIDLFSWDVTMLFLHFRRHDDIGSCCLVGGNKNVRYRQ